MARLLAPLALAAVVVAMLMIFSSGSEDSVNGSDSGVSASTPNNGGNGGNGNGGDGGNPDGEAEPAPSDVPKKYTVVSGDTLTSIAADFAIETSQIVQLNPDLDPQALMTGEQIKLR